MHIQAAEVLYSQQMSRWAIHKEIPLDPILWIATVVRLQFQQEHPMFGWSQSEPREVGACLHAGLRRREFLKIFDHKKKVK